MSHIGVKTAREIFFKSPAEEPTKGFDFDNGDLAIGETLVSVTETEITYEDDGDPDAEDLVILGTTIVDLTVMVSLSKGIVGRTYHVRCQIETSDDQILEGCGRIRVGEC